MQTQIFRGVETTTYTDDDGALCGVYRGTCVARKLQDDSVVLNSGGWRTATTKDRMNQFAASYCDNRFAVVQRNGEWFVMTRTNDDELDEKGYWDEENKRPYTDGMTI